MNKFMEMLSGNKKEVVKKESFAKELNELGKNAHTVEELEKEPFVKELMDVIAKVNRGMNFDYNGERVCYLVNKLTRANGHMDEKQGNSYEFLFSLKGLQNERIDTLGLEYVKYPNKEANLWINDMRKNSSFSAEKLSDENSDFHFANSNQERFFNDIKNAISDFIETKEK